MAHSSAVTPSERICPKPTALVQPQLYQGFLQYNLWKGIQLLREFFKERYLNCVAASQSEPPERAAARWVPGPGIRCPVTGAFFFPPLNGLVLVIAHGATERVLSPGTCPGAFFVKIS